MHSWVELNLYSFQFEDGHANHLRYKSQSLLQNLCTSDVTFWKNSQLTWFLWEMQQISPFAFWGLQNTAPAKEKD